MTEITQDELNGLVTPAELPKAVGFTNQREREAALKQASPRTFRVVEADKIADKRTTKPAKTEGRFLTVEHARSVLPPSYSSRQIDGDSYPALHHPPTVEVRAHLAEEVDAMRRRLTEYRERLESERQARADHRRAMLDRWLAGDAAVTVHISDTSTETPENPAAGNRIGELQFGKREFSKKEAASYPGAVAPGSYWIDPETGDEIPVEVE